MQYTNKWYTCTIKERLILSTFHDFSTKHYYVMSITTHQYLNTLWIRLWTFYSLVHTTSSDNDHKRVLTAFCFMYSMTLSSSAFSCCFLISRRARISSLAWFRSCYNTKQWPVSMLWGWEIANGFIRWNYLYLFYNFSVLKKQEMKWKVYKCCRYYIIIKQSFKRIYTAWAYSCLSVTYPKRLLLDFPLLQHDAVLVHHLLHCALHVHVLLVLAL